MSTEAPLRVLLVASSGGHLGQLMAATTALRELAAQGEVQVQWVSFDTPDAIARLTGQQVTWAHHPTNRHLPNLLRNAWLAWRVGRSWRP